MSSRDQQDPSRDKRQNAAGDSESCPTGPRFGGASPNSHRKGPTRRDFHGGLETELKKVQDQVHATRDEHTITHDKLKAVTKKQEEDTHQITLLQRGSNCLEKVLGLRRFRQVVNGDRGEPNSAVLDQHHRNIGTVSPRCPIFCLLLSA